MARVVTTPFPIVRRWWQRIGVIYTCTQREAGAPLTDKRLAGLVVQVSPHRSWNVWLEPTTRDDLDHAPS